MPNLLGQVAKFFHGLPAVANAFAGTVYSNAFKLTFFQRATILLHKAVGATGTATITVEASSDSSGTGATAIPFKLFKNTNTGSSDSMGAVTNVAATGFTTTAGSNQLYQIEVDAKDLPEGLPWIRLKSVEVVASPVLGGILVLVHEGKLAQATLPSINT